jgi:hypothetical protein
MSAPASRQILERMMMKRPLAVLVLLACCSASLRADITVTSVTTMEGAMSALTGGASPKMVMRIKGMKARSEIEAMGQTFTGLADLSTKQVLMLHPEDKTATLMSPGGTSANPPSAQPKVEGTFTPTGKSQVINGMKCDEYSFTMSIDLSEMDTSHQAAPAAAAMLKDMTLKMNGSVWTTKEGSAASEYMAFQKLAVTSELASVLAGGMSGISANGLDRVMRGFSGGEGMPYLTEINVTVEGTSPAVDMMKQMGPMKIINKVTAVSTDPLADDLFTLPADYRIVKP